MIRISVVLLFCFAIVTSAFAQLIVVRVPKGQPRKVFHNNSGARIKDTVVSLSLPFWDDFSVSNSPYYPDNRRWQDGESVSLNDGISIKPPSLGAVSFDGLDSLGKPYDQTNALAKGYGDNLISKPINLAEVPQGQRDSVYISFFYQWQGNGEPPDPGDQLELDFKMNSQNDSTQDSTLWATMATFTNPGDSTINDSAFYSVIVPVTDPYFYDQFQFRIRSYGRLSGPWDNWNVDYVYLNSHRFATDLSFPDRTIYSPLTSLFKDYWAIPAKHFFSDSTASSVLKKPTFAVTNLRLDQGQFNGQPINYTSRAEIGMWQEGAVLSQKTVKLDSAFAIIPDLEANQRRIVTLNKIPATQDFDSNADSIRVTLVTGINSGDNIVDHVPPRDSGDYTPNYVPIDFRVNDTTGATYIMSKYYAYDDGTAEFGAGLNQPAAEVAYLFKMITHKPDTIVAIDMYFPDFGDESTQTIRLTIRKDTSIHGVLYQDTVILQRSELNKFWRYKLKTNTTGVKDSFYLGWTQTSSAVIALGLDKSNDTGNRIWYNVNGFWEPNLEVHGSLMIRPVFGKGGVVTGLPPETIVLDAFPNPNSGSFYLSRRPDQLDVLDFTGRRVPFTEDGINDHIKIDLINPAPGMYIVKAFISGKLVTRKIMVHP